MLILKPYQKEAIEIIKTTFKSWFRQYICMPTGSGKTITFLSYAAKNHKRILIIVPSIQLIHQVYKSSLLFYHHSEISRKGDGFDEKIASIHITTIHSLKGAYLEKLAKEQFDLTIIDEAHHSQSSLYRKFIDRRSELFHEKDMLILGVTATPDRLDGKLLDDVLHKKSFSLEILDLIQQNHLSDIEGFSVKTKIDISDVDDHNGDFSLSQLYNKLCTDSRNNLIVNIYKKELQDRKTLVFCINIAHSKKINEMLKASGISSQHIDGSMSDIQKASILESFRSGETSVLCNCQLLTEGFDEPAIDGIILARPTRSRALFTQMVGRGLRIFPGKKNCKIIDIVDLHRNLSGFNSLIEEDKYRDIEDFKSIRDIQEHIIQEKLKVTEFTIERSNFFEQRLFESLEATNSMLNYLNENHIEYFEPISFDEASFLIWLNELKKEYHNGNN